MATWRLTAAREQARRAHLRCWVRRDIQRYRCLRVEIAALRRRIDAENKVQSGR